MYYDGLYSVPNKGHVTKGVLMRKAETEAELVYVTLQWMGKDGVRLNMDRWKVILQRGIRDFVVSGENAFYGGKFLDNNINNKKNNNNNNNCYYYYYYFVLILNQIISTHSIPTYVIKILFNIIFPLTL